MEALPSIESEAFEFVRALARELSAETIDLPSFPDVVVRIRRALANDNVSTEGVARIVAAEPALAANVLRMANSAAFAGAGGRVTELPGAIVRLGLNTVRSASMAFAFEQMRKAAEYRSIAAQLRRLWQRSIVLAALSHVTARRFSRGSADVAMLAGLVHGVGKLYILTRASRHPRLFSSRSALEDILRDWHASVAKALLESWEMPEEIVRAVYDFENDAREVRGSIQLTDALALASVLATHAESAPAVPGVPPGAPAAAAERRARLERALRELPAAARLKATAEDCELALQESRTEVAELLRMLGPADGGGATPH